MDHKAENIYSLALANESVLMSALKKRKLPDSGLGAKKLLVRKEKLWNSVIFFLF